MHHLYNGSSKGLKNHYTKAHASIMLTAYALVYSKQSSVSIIKRYYMKNIKNFLGEEFCLEQFLILNLSITNNKQATPLLPLTVESIYFREMET